MKQKEYRKKVEELTKKYCDAVSLAAQRYVNDLNELNWKYYVGDKIVGEELI